METRPTPDIAWDSGFGGLLRLPLLAGLIAGAVVALALWTPAGARLRQRLGLGIAAASTAAIVAVWVPGWPAVLLVLLGAAAAVLARPRPPPDTPLTVLLLAVTAVGLYGTLPEPDGALALLGVVMVALGVAIHPAVKVGAGGWFACVVLVLGLVALDGHRGGAYVGGAACLGLLPLLPAVQHGKPTVLWRTAVFASHTAYVIYASRGPGLEESAADAAAQLVLPTLALAFVAVVLGVAAREIHASQGQILSE